MLSRIQQVGKKIIKLAGESLRTTFPAQGSGIKSTGFAASEKALRRKLGPLQPLELIDYNKRKEAVIASDQKYQRHFLTFLSAMLGFPTRNFTWDKEDDKAPDAYGYNMLQNVAALPERHSATPSQKKISGSYIFPILYTLWNVALIPFKLAINLIRLFTEFLPNFVYQLSYEIGRLSASKLRLIRDEKSLSESARLTFSFLPAILLFVAIAGVVVSRFVEFFTLAFSSPRMAANRFLQLSRNSIKNGDMFFAWLYRGLMVLSVLISLTEHIAFFGFAVPAMLLWGTITLPGALAAACENIVIAYLSIPNSAPFIFAPLGSIISNVITYFIPSLIVTVSDATIGVSMIVGTVVLGFSTLMQYVKGFDSDWFHRDALMTYLHKPLPLSSSPQEEKKGYLEIKKLPTLHKRASSLTTTKILSSAKNDDIELAPPPRIRSLTPGSQPQRSHTRSASAATPLSFPSLPLGGQSSVYKNSPGSPYQAPKSARASIQVSRPPSSPGSSPPTKAVKHSPSSSPSAYPDKASTSPKQIDVRHIVLPDIPPGPSTPGRSHSTRY